MILLDATTKSLQVLLGGAVATNELIIVATYADLTSTGTTLAEADTLTTGATAVTAVAAPAASTTRKVLGLNVMNNDTVAATVTVRLNNNGTLRKMITATLASGSTLVMTREGWTVIETTTGAPADADYLVKTANATLSAERVVTDNTDITFDWSVGGVVKALLGAFTGDITKTAGSLATTIANLAVTTAKIAANAVTLAKFVQATTTQRVVGRNTAGAGDFEEVTLSQLLDWIGSAAQGDVLYRGAASWARLPAGTSGQFLKTNGAGANPEWATVAAASKPNLQWTAQGHQPLATAYATPDTRNSHPVLDLDPDTDEDAVFGGVLPTTYAGGGLTVEIYWTATSATTGDVVLNAAIERMNTDLDVDSFAAAQTATSTTNGTSGIITKTTITFTDGAQMDSLAAGEAFRIRITRDANAAGDTMAGDAELHRVVVRET